MKKWTIALIGMAVLASVAYVAVAQPRRPLGPPNEGGDRGPAGEREIRRPHDRPQGERDRGNRPPGQGPRFHRPPPAVMVALDTDRDGELSAEEIAKAVEALKGLDKDGDGKLSRRELRPPPPPRDGKGDGAQGRRRPPRPGQGPGNDENDDRPRRRRPPRRPDRGDE